jgi:molybdenum cofactor cytidylyltransferase
MYRLASELGRLGWRVVTSTTAKIWPPSATQTEALVVESRADQALRSVEQALRRKHIITLASARSEPEGKLLGIDPDLIKLLATKADAVIVEADGARGLSLKAPAAHEPVVPAVTSLLVPVVGIDVVGQRLTAKSAHRPELVGEVAGLRPGEPVTTSTLAKLLVHQRGALKGAPATCRVAPLVNKARGTSALGAARQVASLVKGHPALWRVLIGTVASDDPIVECWRRVSAVVLAAGGSTRFGTPKQLLDFQGESIIEHVLRVLCSTSVDEVIVVLGHAAERIGPHVASGCRVVLNADWKAGISSSIRIGLEAVRHDSEAALFVLADQPCVSAEAIERILRAYYGSTMPIVVPVHQGQRGNPVLFDRRLFPALRQLRGDAGGRQILEHVPEAVLAVEMSAPDMFQDVDTQADYHKLMGKEPE